MNTYRIWTSTSDFGRIEAESAQEARDKAAQMAGYEDEADMEKQLGADGDLCAERVG